MGIDVSKTCRHKKVAPVLLRQLDRFVESRNFSSAQLQRCKAKPLQLKLIALFAKREIIAALMKKKLSDLASQTRRKQCSDVLFGLWTQPD